MTNTATVHLGMMRLVMGATYEYSMVHTQQCSYTVTMQIMIMHTRMMVHTVMHTVMVRTVAIHAYSTVMVQIMTMHTRSPELVHR